MFPLERVGIDSRRRGGGCLAPPPPKKPHPGTSTDAMPLVPVFQGTWPMAVRGPTRGHPPPPQRAIYVHQTTSHFHRRCGQIMIGTADRRASTAVGGEGLPLGRLRSDPRPQGHEEGGVQNSTAAAARQRVARDPRAL